MAKDKKNKVDPREFTIYNLKSRDYRQVYIDGAMGSFTPKGMVHLNFYSQRNAIPKGSVFEITEEGQLGKLLRNTEDSKEGIVREMEFGVYMDITTCISIRNWLDNKIREHQELNKKK